MVSVKLFKHYQFPQFIAWPHIHLSFLHSYLIVACCLCLYSRALIKRDYDLYWSGTNAHFIFGMFSFAYLIAVRGYFNLGGGLLGRGVAGLAASALLYMLGIVNRGVASGSGDGLSYGNNVMSLFRHYLALVLARKSGCSRYCCFCPMELGAVALAVGSLIMVAQGTIDSQREYDV